MWVGAFVHDQIGSLVKHLRQGQSLPEKTQFLEDARRAFADRWAGSENETPEAARLWEHAHGTPLPPEAFDRDWAIAEAALRWFVGSRWAQRLAEVSPGSWKAVDEVLDFDVDGVKTFVKIDCALDIGGRFVLMDWKTSAPRPEDDFSLRLMALYAQEVWGAAEGGVDSLALCLTDGRQRRAEVDAASMAILRERLRAEAGRLDSETRLHAAWGDDWRAVPATPRMAVCARCQFHSMCYPSGAAANRTADRKASYAI